MTLGSSIEYLERWSVTTHINKQLTGSLFDDEPFDESEGELDHLINFYIHHEVLEFLNWSIGVLTSTSLYS